MSKYRFSNWLVSLAAVFLVFTSTNVASNSPTDNTKVPTSDVGSLKGNFQVTPTGQAHYSIPIDVPPGTAGMAPALSIVYDSSSSNTRNGMLGMGFSLEGLTAITRCPSNKTQNGLIHGVDFTDQDRFCLNGEQLVAINGAYGANGTEYKTYIDSKAKIISYGRQGNGPAGFKVWTKGGQTAEYGFTSESQVKAQGKDSVALWGLNRIQDTAGNYLDVQYFKNENQGSFYPTEINYTGNERAEPKLIPYNSIKFIYEERPDIKTTYQAGSKNTLDKRLKSIQVYQSSNLVYEYRLEYEISKNTFRSRITSIQKCTGSGVCLPPTKFEWQVNEDGWEWAPQFIPPTNIILAHDTGKGYHTEDLGVEFIDLNGSGRLDIVQSTFRTPNEHKVGAWINTGDGWDKSPKYKLPTDIILAHDTGKGYHTEDLGVEFVDLNGNGLPDIVQSSSRDPNDHRIGAWINTGNGWKESPNYKLPTDISVADKERYYSQDLGVRFIDLNGSGLPCMVQSTFRFPNGHRVGAWINTGNGWEEYPNYNPPVDLILAHDTGMGYHTEDLGVRFVDLNGSGLPSIVQSTSRASNEHRVGAWVNTGNGWKYSQNYIPPTDITTGVEDDKLGYHVEDLGVVFVDLNGSGLPSIVQSTFRAPNDHRQGAWLNKAKKLPDYLISVTDGFGTKLSIDYEPLSGTKVKVYTKEHDAKYPNMDWQGPMYVVYQTSSDTATNDPKAINLPNNLDHITTYHYTGAKFNHLGLGFLGFHKVATTDKTTDISTTTTYSQDLDLHNKGMPVAIETRLANGTLLSQSEDSWELKTFGDGNVNTTYYSPYIKKSTKEARDLKGNLLSTTTVESTFDDYANPLKITASVQDATTNEIYTTITENTYQNDSQKWFIGELTSAKVTKSATNRPAQIRTSTFVYDPKTSLLMQTTASSDDSKLALITKYERDNFGNIKNTIVWGQEDAETRSTQVKYDSFGRFVTQITNPLDQSTYQEVDPRFGVVTKSIDLNGLITHYQYDDFARQVGQTSPDGTRTNINYNWFNPESVPTGEIRSALKNCSYVVTSHTQNSTTQQEYFDILGRKVASTTENVNHKIIWQLTYYDELGRVSQKSQPFFADDFIYQTKIQYDILGRVIQSILPDDSYSQIKYDGFITITTNQLKQKQTKQVNALGELIKATDNIGSETTYKYDAYGNMISMTDSAGNESKIEYDHLGRKTAINDPDKGRWSYQYDVYGNLVSQTDALNQTTIFKYDKLNRMISRTDNAGTSTWEYDTAMFGIGKLAIVNSVNYKTSREQLELSKKAIDDGLETYTRRYRYDSFSRLAQATTTIKDKVYSSEYDYDQNSRVAIETYPNGLQVRNNYNDLGYLVKISDARNEEKVYWSLNATDAAGHTTSESRSNGLITNYTYDPKTGFLNNIDTVLSSILTVQQKLFPEVTGVTAIQQTLDEIVNSTVVMQREVYDYDILGNVKKHHDVVNGGYEEYEYDELHRLTQAQIVGRAPELFRYDPLGNITYKSDVGAYKYGENGAGPHAVTSISGKMPATFQYDANGDQIGATINGVKRSIAYTSYSKPLTITTPNATVSFYYNADRQKFARIDATPTKTATTYYLGNYEVVTIDTGKTTITQQKAYIGPNTIYIETKDVNDSTNNKTEIYEALHDNLGSVTDITDENGSVKQHFSYLPFGEQKQTKGVVPYHPITHKGFTGHEQIDVEGINLIHMDGRIYDPVIGRFLSADPFVQDPGNSQCLNRYSYCINNPLAFTDPTGFGLCSWVKRNIISPVVHAVKSVVNSTIGRIFTGILVAAITYFTCGLDLWVAAAIGGATTTGLGLATGNGILKSLGEGFLTATIFGGIGKIAESYKSAHDPGAINVPTPNNDKPMQQEPGDGGRAPQGDDFADPASHKSFENASSSGNVPYFQNEMPSKMSDRSGGNHSNGAGSESYSEMLGKLAKVIGEADISFLSPVPLPFHFSLNTEVYCTNRLIHDPIFQTLSGISAPSTPFSKKVAMDYGLISRSVGVGGPKVSPDTNLYSIVGGNVGLKAASSIGATGTRNILRAGGSRWGKYYYAVLGVYSLGYMGKCIYENRE